MSSGALPDVGVVALLAEAGTDGGTLLLHDGALVCNGLGGTHVADKLLDFWDTVVSQAVGMVGADGGSRTGAHCADVVLDAEATGGDCSRRRAWREWVVIWSTWSRAVRSMKRESLP